MIKQKAILSEKNLIIEINAKTRAGSEALYDMYANTLFGVLLKIVPDQEIAQDLLQQSFLKIWYSFESYNPSKGRLFTWMLTIARNLAKDCLRSRAYHKSLKTDSLELNSEYIEKNNTVVLNTDIIGIKGWINTLKQEQKDILNLIYCKGYTHQEVSNELNIPAGTVKTRCRKAIGILQIRFNECEHNLSLTY